LNTAQEKLELADILINTAYDKTQIKAKDNEERIKQFVSNTIEYIDSIILDPENLMIPQSTIDDFKNIRDTLKNTEDASLILEISDEYSNLNLLIEEISEPSETDTKKLTNELEKEFANTQTQISKLKAELQEKLEQENDPQKRAELEAEYSQKQQELEEKIQEKKGVLEEEILIVKQKRAELEAEYSQKQQELENLIGEKTKEFESKISALEKPYLEEKEKLTNELKIEVAKFQTQISKLKAELQEKLNEL
jgi:chromosome segregation ATPase